MSRPAWLAPAVIVVVALLLRLLVVAADQGYVPAHDAFDYDRHARSIAAGDGFPESGYVPGPSALRPPVYPYALGAVYAASGDSIDAGRVFGALLGALAVALLFLVTRRIWGCQVGLVAAAGLAVFPSQVLLSRELLSEQLFVALELGAVLCVLEYRGKRELRWALAAGLLCGIGALTRNPGAVLVVPVLLGLWVQRPRWRGRALAAPLLALLCIVLTMAPWAIRNWIEFGRFVPVTSSAGFGLAGTYNEISEQDAVHPAAWRTPVIVPEYEPLFRAPGIDEATLDSTLRRDATDFAWNHPVYVVEAAARNLLRLFELSPDSVVGRESVPVLTRGIGSDIVAPERLGIALLVLLAAGGVVAIVRVPLPRGPLFLWLVPIFTLLVAAPIAGLPRYRLPADPFLLILGAIAITWLWDKASRARLELT